MLATPQGPKAVAQLGARNGARTSRAHTLAAADGSVAMNPMAGLAATALALPRAGCRALGSRSPQPSDPSARWWIAGWRRAGPGRLGTALTMALSGGLLAALAGPLRAEPAPRPPDLKILEEKTSMREGTHWLGVYGRVAEPDQPGLWRVKLWREWSDRVEISSESIDCRPGRATRAGVSGGRVVVQTLNPGGAISPANRLDHLIWWATCVPEQAGRDPAGLAALARSLGFDGHQQEHFEVLSVPPLPHP